MLEKKNDMMAGSFLPLPVSYILHSNIPLLEKSKTASDAINAMKENSCRCVLVSDSKKEIVGLVSKTDILYKVVSLHKSPNKISLQQIMSSPIISIPPKTSIADALALLEKHGIRQVVVSSGPDIYGIIDREDIITKMEKAMVETSNAFRTDSPLCIMSPLSSISLEDNKSMLICPHCNTKYDDKDLLSKHVKSIHT